MSDALKALDRLANGAINPNIYGTRINAVREDAEIVRAALTVQAETGVNDIDVVSKDGLLPCPFCGGNAECHFENGFEFRTIWHYVSCEKCGNRTDANTENKDFAIKAWNTRTTPPRTEVDVDLDAKALCLEFAEAHDTDGYPFKGELYDIELITFAYDWLLGRFALVQKEAE